MLTLGFGEEWVAWVIPKQPITKVSFSVKSNGSFCRTFNSREAFDRVTHIYIPSFLVRGALDDGNFVWTKLSRFCPTSSHLLFADYSIYFLDGMISECKNIAAILNQLYFTLGQTTNLNNYRIYFV